MTGQKERLRGNQETEERSEITLAGNGSLPRLVGAPAQRLHLVCWQSIALSPFLLFQKWFLYLGSLILLFNFCVSLKQRFSFEILFMCTTITFILEMEPPTHHCSQLPKADSLSPLWRSRGCLVLQCLRITSEIRAVWSPNLIWALQLSRQERGPCI